MDRKALIVTIDETIIPATEDTMESLNHEFARAASQSEARRAAADERFDYIVIDIAIPARRNGRNVDPVHGFHLLEDIRRMANSQDCPVIVCTGNLDCIDYVEAYQGKGATTFISKPFTSRQLARKVRYALKQRQAALPPAKPKRSVQFAGGDFVIHDGFVRVGKARISITTRMARMLRLLARRNAAGDHVALSGEELASELGIQRGQNAIAEMVCNFRKRATAVLNESGITCGPQDLIASGGAGYRLSSWLNVTGAGDDPVNVGHDPDRDPVNAHGDPVTGQNDPDGDTDDPVNDPDEKRRDPVNGTRDPDHDPVTVIDDPDGDPVNDRQSRIVRFLRRGDTIRVSDVVLRCDCSHSTAKRDLSTLRRRGVIEFIGSPRTGHYRLKNR
ncbi:MAG: response regulator [Planctomycetota bacterium]|jgi:DNA-binding response OmpR family regulator